MGEIPILIGDPYGDYLPYIVTQREDNPAYIRSYSGPRHDDKAPNDYHHHMLATAFIADVPTSRGYKR